MDEPVGLEDGPALVVAVGGNFVLGLGVRNAHALARAVKLKAVERAHQVVLVHPACEGEMGKRKRKRR